MTEKKNGIILEYSSDKILLTKYFIFNGKIEGEYKKYYNNGLKVICNYKNERKEGIYKIYYDNGQLWLICNYKNNKLEGEYKSYYRNGQLYRIVNYKDGTIN